MVHLCGEKLPHPGHVCAFFDSATQKYETLLPFIKEAIDVGDDVVTIVDAANIEHHVDEFNRAEIPVAQATATGQLTISSSEEAYLKGEQGILAQLLEFLEDKLESAKQQGHSVRTWGEMSWIGRSSLPIQDILNYEAQVNTLLPDHQCSLICVYDLNNMPTAILSDLLATHPFAIVKGRLRQNPFYVDPTDYLAMLNGP